MPINASIPMSYRPNVALQMRDPLADAERVQSLQARQSQLQDAAELRQFSKRLAAAGKSGDPLDLAKELIASGRPDMVSKGVELQDKIRQMNLSREAYAALIGTAPTTSAATPAAAPAAPAAQVTMPGANGTTIGQVTPQSAVLGRPLGAPGATPPPTNAMAAPAAAPVNAMAAPAAAPVNAMAAQPGATNQTAEINRLMDVAMRFPNTPAGKAAMERAKMMQQMMPEAPSLADRFVPVGNAVFDRQTQRYITKPGGGAVATTPAAAPAAPATPKVGLEKGEVFNPETQRIEAVPGSQRYINQSKEHAKSLSTVKTVGQKTKSTMDKIDYILAPDQKDAFAYNFGGYPEKFAGQYFPGGASDLRKKIDSLRSNLKMAGLELIRQGGSIGQMTEREWPIVEQMLAALDSVQSEEDARDTLGLIKEQLAKIQRNANDIYTAQWGQTQYFKKPPTATAKTPEKAAPSAANQIPGDVGNAPVAAPMYARNPSTGERIMSTDGGQTWRPAE